MLKIKRAKPMTMITDVTIEFIGTKKFSIVAIIPNIASPVTGTRTKCAGSSVCEYVLW
jgi:hypothetical protein